MGKLAAILKSPYYRTRLLRHRVAAGVEHARVLSGLDCRTVVDIGANRGQFALVARRCLPQARVISFEPLPAAAAKFRAVFADDDRVTLHEVAIGPVRRECDPSHFQAGRFFLPVAHHHHTGRPISPARRKRPPRSFAWPRCASLSWCRTILPPALLKLDVQGFELEALRGCEDLLDRFAYVYAECSFVELYAGQALADEVIAWLRERGFNHQGEHNMVHESGGRAIQADFLFAR